MQQRLDALGMRHTASQLRATADRAAIVSARIDAQVASMIYTGPAADQFRGMTREIRDNLNHNIAVIRELAEIYTKGAALFESDPTRQAGGRS